MIRDKWKIDDGYKEKCIEDITGKLTALRATLDISQDELAGLIGVSRSTYNAMETGRRPMPWPTYLAIMGVLFANEKTRSILKEFNLYPKEFIQRIESNCPFEGYAAEEVDK